MIISTNDLQQTSPVNYTDGRYDESDYHTYFLVKDNNNTWYAGSPANHLSLDDKGYALTIIQNRSLSILIENLEKRDKATYPKPEDILKRIHDTKNNLNTPKNKINIPEIKYTSRGVEYNSSQFSPTKQTRPINLSSFATV